MNLKEAVIYILINEHCRTKEDAENLIKKYPEVLLIHLNPSVVAMALEIKESEEQ